MGFDPRYLWLSSPASNHCASPPCAVSLSLLIVMLYKSKSKNQWSILHDHLNVWDWILLNLQNPENISSFRENSSVWKKKSRQKSRVNSGSEPVKHWIWIKWKFPTRTWYLNNGTCFVKSPHVVTNPVHCAGNMKTTSRMSSRLRFSFGFPNWSLFPVANEINISISPTFTWIWARNFWTLRPHRSV